MNLKTGDIIEDTANVVISAKGGLNQIMWPKIKNLETYQGKLIHSGAWDDKYVQTHCSPIEPILIVTA
jgi:cation diffusion facilitator CzcD-associated flavoprotein CzcO